MLRAVLGSALYVALCGLFALGLGTVVRNTAAARAITSTQQDPHLFSAWGELAVFGGYTLTLLVLGVR